MKSYKSKEDLNMPLVNAVKKPVMIQCKQIHEEFEIHTMEGVMKGKAGDWVIVGVEGEIYACDDAIFRKTYDLIQGVEG